MLFTWLDLKGLLKEFLGPIILILVALSCWGWVVWDAQHKGAQKQLHRDAPVIAGAKGDALSAETQASITEGVLKATRKANSNIDAIKTKEVTYVTRIQEAGGVSDDDWRSAILGMRGDRGPSLDGIPEGDQREPASADH